MNEHTAKTEAMNFSNDDTLQVKIQIDFDIEELRLTHLNEKGHNATNSELVMFAKEWFMEEARMSIPHIEAFYIDGLGDSTKVHDVTGY
jgi:hypothetical protein